MTKTEIMEAIVALFPNAVPCRTKTLGNFFAIPSVDEEGNEVHTAVKVTALLAHDTASANAFNVTTAHEEYEAFINAQTERANRPKAERKSKADPVKQAEREVRKTALLAWLMDNPGAHTSEEIKASMPEVYGPLLIMDVGKDATELFNGGAINRKVENRRKYYGFFTEEEKGE